MSDLVFAFVRGKTDWVAVPADKACTCPKCGKTIDVGQPVLWSQYETGWSCGERELRGCEACWPDVFEEGRRRRG
jgi:hypothetical protein